MKPIRKLLLTVGAALVALLGVEQIAVSSIPLGGSIFPLTFITTAPVNVTDGFNQLLSIINQQVVGISTLYSNALSVPIGGVDSSPVTPSTTLQQNPLVQITNQYVLTSPNLNAAATSGLQSGLSAGQYILLASQTGRAIHMAGPGYIMASNVAASGITAIELVCNNAGTIGNVLESFTSLANMTANQPFTSLATTLNSGFMMGCPSNSALMASIAGGTLVSSAGILFQIPVYAQ